MSHVSALDRDVHRLQAASQVIGTHQRILAMTSGVAILAIVLAYAGQSHTSTAGGRVDGREPVNLNTVEDAKALEPALVEALPNDLDRRAAAEGLLRFVIGRREAGHELQNVGALLEARVRSSESEVRDPKESPRPLLTTTALAAIKPFMVVRTMETFRRLTFSYAALYIAAFWVVVLVWQARGAHGDRLLLASAHLLTALGFALLVSRGDPLRDQLLFARYTIGVVVGLAVLTAASLVDFRKAAFLRLSYLPLLAALCLSVLLVLFGNGPGSSRARVNLGPVQPIEAIRLLLGFFLAGYFAQRWELLRQVRAERIGRHHVPAWLQLPRPEYVLPMVGGVGAALLFFFVQRDLGPALFLAGVFLAMYSVARARVGMALAGSAVLLCGFYLGYWLKVSDTLTARVRMWQSPWDNAVRGGDQVAQSLWAVATGGWFGAGLGFGDTRYLPAGHTDLVLAAAAEELGVIGLLAIVSVYVLIAARGLWIARRAATDYGFFLAIAVTLFLALPVLMMASGVLGLTPLTGLVTPFLSYGGSAMVANLSALGVLVAISQQPTRGSALDIPQSPRLVGSVSSASDAALTPFARPTAGLGTALAGAAAVIVAVMVRVSVVSADDLALRPHLSLQADGVRRYQYNPRVLDIARSIPRGTIYDRAGLPLATGESEVASRVRSWYARHNVAVDESCDPPIERCYPLGGAAFHVLGNATTRLNWSASNTSFVERDAEARLRGFDDHATTVAYADADGRQHAAIRRDYRDLLPLLRHRHEPAHPAVRAFLARPRDLRLTVDARLQSSVSAILARHAAQSATGHAAAIVIDPDTGHLLAAASYPYPSLDSRADNEATDEAMLLDRARYGLYPPGSTFKLVTAAAALDNGLNPAEMTFACSYLPDGRVGAKVSGWSRPIRDDVLDKRPHGRLGLHGGLVHSCNGYFAQLAVRVGARSLMETAASLGIAAAPGSSVRRLRDMLPQAGYGQGDVVATPLRMARVVAALASGGTVRDVSWEADADAGASRAAVRLLPPESARLLARHLRDAVLSGTGRALASHPMRIAGKTGTAEVANAASHSWFVGFAPFEGSAKKVAFAVIVENAGYGGSVAARLAGDIVTAAADVGLIR